MEEEPRIEILNNNYYPPKPLVGKAEGKISYISILLFIVAYYFIFDKNLTFIFLLVAIVFIHEMGHLLMMKVFHYNEVNMLFVPFFGALVTGEKQIISQKQRSFIILAGPVPGIIIGMGLYYINAFYFPNEIIKKAADIFISLNIFNLLPFIPFDGGLLIENLFFSTGKKIQNVFITISAVVIGSLAIMTENYLLLLLPVLSIIRILHNNRVTKIRSTLSHYSIDYVKSYDELTNEEYWKIRDCVIESDPKTYINETVGVYRISAKEGKILSEIKGILQLKFNKDLGIIGRLTFLLVWLFFIFAPLIIIVLDLIKSLPH